MSQIHVTNGRDLQRLYVAHRYKVGLKMVAFAETDDGHRLARLCAVEICVRESSHPGRGARQCTRMKQLFAAEYANDDIGDIEFARRLDKWT